MVRYTQILFFVFSIALLSGCAEKDDNWKDWVGEWKRWEAIAHQQDWDVTPLKIKPPVNSIDLKALEYQAGVSMPHQLRKLMLERSRGVEFGWIIPIHLNALDGQNLPSGSATRGVLWDLEHIQKVAIPNFVGWRDNRSNQLESEAYNSPELWENQFPLSELVNGDMITIDVSNSDKQPVRYFSHELEGWHGTEIAPDLYTYIAERSRLGWAGTEQDSMFRFTLDPQADTVRLDSTIPGAVEWIEWATRDPNEVVPNMPPRIIVAETAAERNLLNAARDGNHKGVRKALLSGARPDVAATLDMRLEDRRWGWTYDTSFGMAVAQNDLTMAQILLDFGATINTRHLPMEIAVKSGTYETIAWLIERGARVNGWAPTQEPPLHRLVLERGASIKASREAYANSLPPKPANLQREAFERLREKQITEYFDRDTYLKILELLLKSGAQFDQRGINNSTVLMWVGVEDAKLLLDYGANPNVTEYSGFTALQYNRKSGMTSLLLSRGADVNFAGTPVDPKDIQANYSTPIQFALSFEKNADEPSAYLKKILAAGGDPLQLDNSGSSTLAYVRTLKRYEEMLALGLDPLAKQAEGGTLLHRLARTLVVQSPDTEVWKITDRILDAGVDINARDANGQTALHKLVQYPWVAPAPIVALIKRGADISIRDANGELAADVVHKNAELKNVLKLLKN